MYQSNKKSIITGKHLDENLSCSDTESESDNFSSALEYLQNDEEVQGQFIFLKNKTKTKKSSKLSLENYIDE
tara:strand:+ start:1031 stop:1246 length:216 start_codon:yes stop_codon:yes gene_type:complete